MTATVSAAVERHRLDGWLDDRISEAVIYKAIFFSFFAVLVVIVARQPAAATGALVCTWALDQWLRSQDSYFTINHGLTNWSTSLTLLLAIVLRFFKGRPLIQPFTREYALTMAIYLLAIVSYVWSIRPSDTLEQYANSIRVIILFAFVVPLSIADFADLRGTFYTILTLGFAIAGLTLSTGDWQGRMLIFKTGGVFAEEGLGGGNPLATATLGCYTAIIAMLMNFRGAARIWQALRYAVIATGFALSVKTGSRGQTVSILFVIICFLPFSRRFKDVRGFLAFSMSMALFGTITLYLISVISSTEVAGLNGVGGRWTWEGFVGEYKGGRVDTSLLLIYAWINSSPFNWIFGLGSSASFDPQIIGFYPHVVFAEVLGELGLVGWVMLWMFPIFCYKNLRELWTYTKDTPEERGLAATLGAMVLFEIMMSFKQGSLLGSAPLFAWIIILGRVTATMRKQQAEYRALDAGMYAMSAADWEDYVEEPEEDPYPSALVGGALARGS